LLEKSSIERQDQTKERPRILPLPNGPYYLLNDMEPRVVENLCNSKDEPLSTVRGVALCRCGASNNKPFCDGTHTTIGFSSENRTDDDNSNGSSEHLIKNKRKNYVGEEIIIHDNRRICSHAEECVNTLSSVFKLNSRPWIDPDSAKAQEIIDTIRKCPSGALSYSINDIEYRDQEERTPMVIVSKDGPYLITGSIDLIGENIQWADGASKEHYTLCRCGASSYKPFCDGMHKTVNFKDDKN
jgi:CDGSH-type Zn-finger protein